MMIPYSKPGYRKHIIWIFFLLLFLQVTLYARQIFFKFNLTANSFKNIYSAMKQVTVFMGELLNHSLNQFIQNTDSFSIEKCL